MERGREEQGLMEGGECGGGQMEGRECWGWGMLPCMRGEPPRLLASYDGVLLSSRVDSASCVASSSRVACSSCVTSPTCVAFSSCVTSSLPVASLHVSPVFVCCCRRTLSVGGGAGRLQLLVVLGPRRRPWGGLVTIPQCPRDIRGVGARLVCYPVCAVVLGLQTRLVKGGR